MKKNVRPIILTALLALLANVLFYHEFYIVGNTSITNEGEAVENISAFCFIFSSILLSYLSFEKKGLELKLNSLFSLTCLLLFIREVDIEKCNLPAIIQWAGAGDGRDLIFGTLYALLISSVVISERKNLLKVATRAFSTPIAITTLCGCFLFLLADPFEDADLIFFEEMIELNGATLIMLASILSISTPLLPEKIKSEQSTL